MCAGCVCARVKLLDRFADCMRRERDGCRSTEVRTPLSEMTPVSIGDFSRELHRHFCFDLSIFFNFPQPPPRCGGSAEGGDAAHRSVCRLEAGERSRISPRARGRLFKLELCPRADITCRGNGRGFVKNGQISTIDVSSGGSIYLLAVAIGREPSVPPRTSESSPESAGLSTRRSPHTNITLSAKTTSSAAAAAP